MNPLEILKLFLLETYEDYEIDSIIHLISILMTLSDLEFNEEKMLDFIDKYLKHFGSGLLIYFLDK
jgi:hypothetical protein